MHEYESSLNAFDFRYYTPSNWYFVVPSILHAILFYGIPLVALASLVAFIWGIAKKKRKNYLIIWSLAFIFSAVLTFLTWSGHIVGHDMFGG
jgi:uncharacterized membrane protein